MKGVKPGSTDVDTGFGADGASLRNEPEKNVRIAQPVSVIVERVFRDEIGPLKEQVSDLAEKLNAINNTKKRMRCQRKSIALTRKCAPRSFARQAGAMPR